MEVRYPAMLELESDGGYFVRFVDLPDTFTEGRSKDEALVNAREVLSAMLGWRRSKGMEVPAPSDRVEGAHYVLPDASFRRVGAR